MTQATNKINLLTTKQVAEYLDTSEKWVRDTYRNRSSTKFPKARKIGKGFKFLKEEVDSWVKVHA